MLYNVTLYLIYVTSKKDKRTSEGLKKEINTVELLEKEYIICMKIRLRG